MEFVNSILFSAGINIFNISVVSCAVIAALCILVAVIAALIRCQVVYVDPEGDYEIEFEKKKWLSKVILRPAFKLGKSFVGWSLDPNGENMITEPEFMLTHTYVLYAVWKDEAKVAKDGEGVFVQLNYLDAEGEDVVKSCIYKVNTVLPENQEIAVKVNGWAFEKGGKAVLAGENASAIFSINLYPVFDDKTTSNAAFEGDVVCELLFIDSNTDAFIYKESHYFDLEIPEAWSTSSSFVGWSVEPNGEAIIERGDDDAVFTIQLFSVDGEPKAVLVDEPYVAPVIEEVKVEEPTPEEPELAEEIVEEEMPVAEEPVVEEPVLEEPVVEEPVVEEPVAEEPVVEEPVAEEPVVEESVVEDPVAEEPVAEEPVVEEPVVEEPAPEEPVEIVPTVIPTYFDNEGNKIDIKYSRSFTANLIQSDDTVKDYYGQLKNHILSYKGVKSKISWKFDSYNRGRDQLFKIKFRGKTILLYCALDPEEFDKAKYHHEAVNAKIFADVPMLLKVKSGLGLRKAKEIVDIVMAKFGIEPNPKAKTVDYVNEYPYEETEALLARKLVKILEADGDVVVISTKEKEAEPVVEEPVVEESVVEEPVVEESVVEEPVVEEPVVEEPVVEEPVVEEPVVEEPVVEEPVVEEEIFEIHEAIVEEVSSEEADKIAEEQHIDATMDEGIDYITAKDTKKVIVNIDSISKAYNAGEIVNIASLKEKKLIVKNAKFVKVLARGTLDKPLKIKAGEFSDTAIKMIRLVGGSPTHVKYVIKK